MKNSEGIPNEGNGEGTREEIEVDCNAACDEDIEVDIKPLYKIKININLICVPSAGYST